MISPEELGLEVASYSGDEAIVRCPYHDDRTPSAEFNIRTGLFYCFVCGTGKRATDIAKEFGGFIRESEIEYKERKEPDIDWRTRFLGYPLALDNEYLKSRKVSNVAVRKLDIRAFDDGIIFPMFSSTQGDTSGVQVRYYTRQPKYVFYGDRPPVYPMIGFPVRGTAILVEGVFSVIRGREAGFEVFAVLGATALAQPIKFFYDRSRVLGIFDPDEAGYIASAKLAAIGIGCMKHKFVADEESVETWKEMVPNKGNFSMDAGLFAKAAVNAGGKPNTVLKQITKFEKENK